jgi:hypothetical protein
MRNCDYPALVFVTPESAPPPEISELLEGDLVDLRPRIFVPSEDADTWSQASRIHALQILAEKPSLEHYPEWSTGFCAMKLAKDEFFSWIAVRGFPYPKFWKRTNDDATSLNLKPASERTIKDEIQRVYDIADKEGSKPPNIKEVAKPVQARLQEIRQRATAAQIQKIADRPEFKKRRNPPGKTLKSEKPGPSK